MEEEAPVRPEGLCPGAFVQRVGYAVRAPPAPRQAELRAGHRRDEAAQERLAARRRREGLEHLKAGGSQCLGGSRGLDAAREAQQKALDQRREGQAGVRPRNQHLWP